MKQTRESTRIKPKKPVVLQMLNDIDKAIAGTGRVKVAKKDITNGWNTPEAQQVLKNQLESARENADDYANTAVTLAEMTKDLIEAEELLKGFYSMYIEGHGVGQKCVRDTQDYLTKHKLI